MKFLKKYYFRSLSIYFLFTRYSVIGLLSFIIDVSVFALLYRTTQDRFYSLLIGRLLSGSFNFYFNKYLVYRSMRWSYTKREALYYVGLAIVIFVSSYTLISELTSRLGINIITAKILVDVVLFFINFIIQKYLFRTGTLASLKTKSTEDMTCKERD